MRILLHVGLLLNSFEFHEEELTSILDFGLNPLLLTLFYIGINQLGENSVIDGQPVKVVEMLYKFQTHGAPDSPVSG